MKNYIGKLGSAGSLQECSTVILNVFENLQGIQKHFKIFAEEIQIKPRISVSGILFSVDEPEKPAKLF